jgi:peroxiredoxin
MTPSSRRLLFFVVALTAGLSLLAVLLRLLTQPTRPAATPRPPASPTAQIVATLDDEPVSLEEWERAVALDQVMSALVGQTPPNPEDTLQQLINRRLVLRAAVAADILEPDQAQAEAWLARFLADWGLDEAALDQVLTRADLTRAELVGEVVPRLLQVEQALNQLSPGGDTEAWVSSLREQAQVEILAHLTSPPSQSVPQPTSSVAPLSPGPRVGDLAPDFDLPATEGAAVRLFDLRGRPVLLNFWATWCGPCRQELPALQTTFQAHAGDLTILGINVRESPDQVTRFATDLDLTLPLLLDQEGRVSDAYQVRGLPTSLFIDRNGLIVARHVGPLDQATLDDYLTFLLGTPAISSPTP